MSGWLAGKVWQSGLSPNLKPLAAALADIANDDGTSIWPSVKYMAWLLGRTQRSVQITLAQLRDDGVLVTVAHANGGRGMPTEYRLIEGKLPQRPPWSAVRDDGEVPTEKGESSSPFIPKGEEGDTVKGEDFAEKGCKNQQERVKPSSPDPSLTANNDPPKRDPLDSLLKGGITVEVINNLVNEFDDVYTRDEVLDLIADAQAHTSWRKWTDKQRGIRNWIKSEIKRDRPYGRQQVPPPQRLAATSHEELALRNPPANLAVDYTPPEVQNPRARDIWERLLAALENGLAGPNYRIISKSAGWQLVGNSIYVAVDEVFTAELLRRVEQMVTKHLNAIVHTALEPKYFVKRGDDVRDNKSEQ